MQWFQEQSLNKHSRKIRIKKNYYLSAASKKKIQSSFHNNVFLNKKAEHLLRELIYTDLENHLIGEHIFEHAQLRTSFLSMFMQGPLLKNMTDKFWGKLMLGS